MSWLRFIRRNISEHRGRAIVSVVSIALGVSVYIGVATGVRAVQDQLSQAAGRRPANFVAIAPIGVWQTTALRAAAGNLERLPDVVIAYAGLNQHLSVPLGPAGALPLDVFGADDRSVSAYSVVAGHAPAPGADQVIVDAATARAFAAPVGTTFILNTPTGPHQVAIAGLANFGGSSNFAVTSLSAAQRWAGGGDQVTEININLRRGVNATGWAAAHRPEFGPFEVVDFSFGGRPEQQVFFGDLASGLAPISAAALLVAGYLIFLTIRRNVQDRATVHGTLRALGATRGRLIGVVIGEALALGVVGTALGLALGAVNGAGVAKAMSGIFSVPLTHPPHIGTALTVAMVGTALGLATPVVAAAIPARRAAAVDPAVVLRGGATTRLASQPTLLIGGGLAVAGVADMLAGPRGLRPFGLAAAVLAILFLTAPLPGLMATVTARLWARLAGGAGETAAIRLSRQPARAGSTIGLLAATLAVVVAVVSLGLSARHTFISIVRGTFGTDAVVVPGSNNPLPEPVVRAVTSSTLVRAASAGGQGHVTVIDGGPKAQHLLVVDPSTYFSVGGFTWASGGSTARAQLSAGHRVLLAASIATRLHKHVGDPITLQTSNGPTRYTVAATFLALPYGDTLAVVMSTDDARRDLKMDGVNRVWVNLAGGARPEALQRQLKAAAPLAGSYVSDNRPLRASIVRGFDGIWNLITMILIITVGLVVFGLANTLVMDVLERRNEFAVLRAIGTHRREISRMLLTEATTITAAAGAAGVAAGSWLGWLVVRNLTPAQTTTLSSHYYRYPLGFVVALGVAAIAIGAIASVVPGRRATAIDPSVALRAD